jgi:hypothetical protein
MNLRRFFLAVVVVAGMVVMSHSVAFAQGIPLFAVLLGGNEVDPETNEAGVGDTDGYGRATVIIAGDTVCFGLVFDNIGTPTLAHIHENVAGQIGNVVVDFVGGESPIELPTSGNPGSVSGCVSGAAIHDASALTRIRSNPSNFYVNVHNRAFPGGAIRGQLF